MLLLIVLLPLLLAPAGYVLEKKRAGAGAAVTLLVCLLCGALLCFCKSTLTVSAVMGFGLRFSGEGFRRGYALIALLLWLCASLLSKSYFKGHENTPRYTLYTLLSLCGTLGVFLADSLMTLYLFFELMSLCSYPWVAQEETPGAMRAAQTYLYIALIGGMAMLMGLFLLPKGCALLSYGDLRSMQGLSLPCYLMLAGFGAKAGMFPLHVWLPKAHPVAPAPASALLSGALTKTGVFGAILLSFTLMRGDTAWGWTVLALGAVTMLLGALLALLSSDLKRTLACSSLSQIGFILTGLGAAALSGAEASTSLYGVAGHMLNHSLVKTGLFLLAGCFVMTRHTLSLNELRGAGRGKPLLNICFLILGLSLAGVPPFSGYASKTLLHEGILEAAASTGSPLVTVVEWVFLLSGGLTLCYMAKLYRCLFLQKGEPHADKKLPMSASLSVLLPTLAALFVGLTAQTDLSAISWLGGALTRLCGCEGGNMIALYSPDSLSGAGISIAIGIALFFVARRLWTDQSGTYIDKLPRRLDMENSLYRPLLAGLRRVGEAVARPLGAMTDALVPWLIALGTALCALLGRMTDALLAFFSGTVFRQKPKKQPAPEGRRLAYAAGSALDAGARVLNRTVRRSAPITKSYVALLTAGEEEASRQTRRLTRSVSYGLLLFCVGLLVVLGYLLISNA